VKIVREVPKEPIYLDARNRQGFGGQVRYFL